MTAQGGGGVEGEVPPMEGITTYVFSRTLRSVSGGAQLVSGDAAEFVRDLKRQPGKGICLMGGSELARSLLEAGLVDEVGANIHPILLGAGVPLFRDPGRRIPLELIESRTMDGGCVLATYRVRQGG
jgi:dihydrofolate reductase